MNPRRPVAASQSNPLPSLDALKSPPGDALFPEPPPQTKPVSRAPGVLASATLVTVAGAGSMIDTQAPVCGPTRADELRQHGGEAVSALRGGHAVRTLREIGVAMGWIEHPSTTSVQPDPRTLAPGAMPVVNVAPQVPPQVDQADGSVMPVGPAPRDPYPHRPHATEAPATTPATRAQPHTLQEPSLTQGGAGSSRLQGSGGVRAVTPTGRSNPFF